MFSVLLSVYYNESPYYFRQSIDSLFNQSLQLALIPQHYYKIFFLST